MYKYLAGKTVNLAESIYFTKINRKCAIRPFFYFNKNKTFQNTRAHFSVLKIAEFGKFKKVAEFV